jgi:hypothetical protein
MKVGLVGSDRLFGGLLEELVDHEDIVDLLQGFVAEDAALLRLVRGRGPAWSMEKPRARSNRSP